MKHIPNIITSLNLVSGFIGIIFAAQGDIFVASWFIAAAMVFDFLDGFSARLLKAYSNIGKELDSLADVVSFGVAPGIIIFRLLQNSFSGNALINYDLNNPVLTLFLLLPALMPVCAALRLAIFNLDSTQATVFKGLPTPANAIAVISVVIAANYSDSVIVNYFTTSPLLLVLFTIILSILMVTRLPLLSLKLSNFSFKGNEGRYILIGLILIAIMAFGFTALPLIIPLYILASVVENIFF